MRALTRSLQAAMRSGRLFFSRCLALRASQRSGSSTFMRAMRARCCSAVFARKAGSCAFLRRHSPLRTTTWATVAGTIVLAPIAASQLAAVDASELTPGVLGAILYSGFLAAGVANVIVLNGVRVVGPTRTSAYQFLVPALAVLLAFLFLSEPIRPGQVIGGLVIVTGVLITRGGAPFRIVRSSTQSH